MTETVESELLSAEVLVTKFLQAMEDRDLESAATMIAPGAQFRFPGGAIFNDLAELILASISRYREIRKSSQLNEIFTDSDGRKIVYVRGKLSGTNNYGVDFDEIRFIDRFVVQDGLIQMQEVWNDLAESGVLARQS